MALALQKLEHSLASLHSTYPLRIRPHLGAMSGKGALSLHPSPRPKPSDSVKMEFSIVSRPVLSVQYNTRSQPTYCKHNRSHTSSCASAKRSYQRLTECYRAIHTSNYSLDINAWSQQDSHVLVTDRTHTLPTVSKQQTLFTSLPTPHNWVIVEGDQRRHAIERGHAERSSGQRHGWGSR